MHAATDHDLLILTHRGDHDAAVRFYRSMAPRLLAYARASLGHDAAAEDAVQQVFVGLFSLSRAEVESVHDVLPWLIRLTRNAALNDARAARRRSAREQGRPHAAPAPGVAPHAELLGGLAALPDDARELIILKHVAGLTFDQMALALDANRNTLASRYRSAMDQLRTVIASPQGVHHA